MTQPTHQNALSLGSMLMEYRLTAVLGAGGFGITYLARDTNLDKDVAIKEYLPGAFAVRAAGSSVLPTSAAHADDYRWGLERFIQEARTLARFSHPNIVRVNRFFEANGSGYMVMDHEDGEPFKAWLQRNPFPEESTLKTLMAPLLDGLEKVHASGFLHRDIKPDNVLVRKDGSPVLIDFGSARQSAGGSQALTTIVSPGYAPFEQYTTTDEQGPWSDIYSLCGVLYLAMTGQNPPDAITRMKSDTLQQGLGAARVRYSGPFVDAITWGLARERQDRPQTIAQLREAMLGQRVPGANVRPGSAAPSARVVALNSATFKATPITRPSDSSPTSQAISPVILMTREERRGPSVLRWLIPVVVALALIVVGLRTIGGTTARKARPVAYHVWERPAGNPSALPRPAGPQDAQSQATEASMDAAASAETDSSHETNESGAAAAHPASEAAPSAEIPPAAPAAAAPQTAVSDPAARIQPPPATGALGMSREELAALYPGISDRFNEIDRDRDGRVNAAELVDAIQQFSPEQRRGLRSAGGRDD
jgi:serine/threonine protein kinase